MSDDEPQQGPFNDKDLRDLRAVIRSVKKIQQDMNVITQNQTGIYKHVHDYDQSLKDVACH